MSLKQFRTIFGLIVSSLAIGSFVMFATTSALSKTQISTGQILTPAGYQNISDIKVGDKVVSYNVATGQKIINEVEKKELVTPKTHGYWEQDEQGNNVKYVERPLVFYLINGIYRLYENQSIHVNSQVIHAFQIKRGDVLYNDELQKINVKTIQEVPLQTPWVRLTISGNHSYIADDLLLHNASRYWVGGAGCLGDPTWSCTTGTTNWSATSEGTSGASVPGASDDVFFDGLGLGGAANSTLSANITINSLDMTGYANTLTHDAAVTLTVDGNGVVFKMVSGMTYTLGSATTSALSFTGTSGTTTIDSGGKTFGNTTFNGVGGTWQLTGNHAVLGTGATLTLTNGAFDANNKNVTAGLFSSSNSNTRVITMGSGTWTLSGVNGGASFPVWDMATTTGLTLTEGTSTIVISDISDTSKTFAGGGETFNNITFTGDDITVSGSNTFSTFAVSNAGEAEGLLLTAGTIQIVTTFSSNGSAGNLAILVSTSAGSAATLFKSSGTVSEDYMSIKDSTATGGATWYAGANSTNVSGNTGWIFTAPATNGKLIFRGDMKLRGDMKFR